MSKTQPLCPLPTIALLSEFIFVGLFSPSQMSASTQSHSPSLYVRLSGGPGAARSTMTFSEDQPDYKVSGSSADFSAAAGVMVFPSIALHGTAFGWVVREPDVDFGDYYVEIGNEFRLTAVGNGLTYYLMSVKVFASASLGTAWVVSDKLDTDAGLAFDVLLAKEWSLKHHLWFAIGGGLNYHSIHDDFGPSSDPSGGTDWTWRGLGGALRFSLTYR